jgi:hypothetical protein
LNRSLSAIVDNATIAAFPVWTTEVLSSSPTSGRVLALNSAMDFDDELRIFSDQFLAPAAIPPARRQYDIGTSADMTELSIRFMGAGTDRITNIVGISNGLAKPPSKKASRVPPKLFPQGRLKRSKTPVVSKGKVGHLHTAAIAEVLYTDTFDSGDHRFPYGQAFVDHASRWGDVIPLRSRKEVGASFVTFVCRHYTPLILVSDNIAENKGGSLVDNADCVMSVRHTHALTIHNRIGLRVTWAVLPRWHHSVWCMRVRRYGCGFGLSVLLFSLTTSWHLILVGRGSGLHLTSFFTANPFPMPVS